MPDLSIERMINYLWRPTESHSPLEKYVIVDAARDHRIYPKLAGSDIEVVSLYRGDPEVELADVAPYLIKLQRKDPFTEWLLNNGWGQSWGIFLESSATLIELRQHFRTFLMVYDEEGDPLYFRYYDPRVLRVYLPTCNESELQTVFGPVSHFYVEGKEKNQLIEFYCNEKFELIRSVIDLQ